MIQIKASSACCDTKQNNSDFTPVFRAAVCSDTHITAVDSIQAERFAMLFRSSYAYADGSTYPNLDCVVVVGDITNHGLSNELEAYRKTADANIRKDRTVLLTVMGGHEFCGGNEEVYRKFISDRLDWHIVVNGFHLIGISTSDLFGKFAEEKCLWLEEQVALANADNPQKPILTFQHLHIKDTVYVSRSWYAPDSERLNDIYKKYPQVINFSGHSHGPVNNPLSVYQKDYTLLGTGTIDYFEMEADMKTETIPENAHDAAQFYLVEIDALNRVRVLPYNLLTDNFFRTPANTGALNPQLIYKIDRPSDKSSFLYTEARRDKAVPPYFKEQARIRWSVPEKGRLQLIFDHAQSAECVYGYFVSYETDNGNSREKGFYSDYYIEPPSASFTAQLDIGDMAPLIHVSIVPVNVWGMRGEALTADIDISKLQTV